MQATFAQPEDALVYLPRKAVMHFARGQTIYDESRPSAGLYLVVQGRVKVCSTVEDGSQVISGLYHADDFFGESAFLGGDASGERAIALDNASTMCWSVAEVEDQIQRQPKLGVALIQMLVGRCMDFEERLQSLALDKTPERVALSLVRLAMRHGKRFEDGSLRIPPLTHQFLSEYVGTSREIVTFQMSHLRRQGFVRYSRKGIDVYPEALLQHVTGS